MESVSKSPKVENSPRPHASCLQLMSIEDDEQVWGRTIDRKKKSSLSSFMDPYQDAES